MDYKKYVQIGYTTRDLPASVRSFAALGTGPFFQGAFPLADMEYRGKKVSYPNLHVAFGYQGDLQIELIELPVQELSFYSELLGDRREGINHSFTPSRDFDATVARYENAGYPVILKGHAGPGIRMAFIDTVSLLGHFVEVLDFEAILAGDTTILKLYDRFKQASVGWDGSESLRPISSLL